MCPRHAARQSAARHVADWYRTFACARAAPACPLTQVVYPLAEEVEVTAGSMLSLLACRTATQVWFVSGRAYSDATADGDTAADASTGSSTATPADPGVPSAAKKARRGKQPRICSDPEICVCGLHTLCNNERLAMLGDAGYVGAFSAAVDGAVADVKARLVASAAGEQGASLVASCLDIADGSMCGLQAATCVYMRAVKATPPPSLPVSPPHESPPAP